MINLKSNRNLIIVIGISLIVVCVVATSFYWLGASNSNTSKNPAGISDVTPIPNGQSKIYGYIYSSGINQTMVRYAKYQITYINSAESQITPTSLAPKIDGLFTLGKDAEIEKYWGQCVELTGIITSDVTEADLVDNFYRVFIEVASITASDKCSLAFEANPTNDSTVKTFTGRIQRSERPEPDITYDYKFILDKPFVDTENASGLDQKVTEIVIAPASIEIFKQMSQKYNTAIEIKGEWIWGFAESKFLLVTNIK